MSEPTKICRVCGLETPYSELVKSKKCIDGVRNLCKKCKNARNRTYYHDDLDQSRQNHREKVKRLRAASPEKSRAKVRQWRADNPDKYQESKRKSDRKYYEQHREQIKVRVKQYSRTTPDMWRARNANRRARKRALPDTLTTEQWNTCLTYWHDCCAYCGHPPGLFVEYRIAADHFVPLTAPDCPGTIAENIIPACNSCNSSKHNSEPIQWITKRFGERKAKAILKRIQDYFDWLESHSVSHDDR